MRVPSIDHLQRLLDLLQTLATDGISMESYEYDGSASGNFRLVVTNGQGKMRFAWDGKESILTVELRKGQNRAEAGTWEHDAFISIPSPQDIFAEIGSEVRTALL